jgi:peroxiredoxin
MKDMLQRYSEKGLVVVAVNLDKEHALAAGFLREFRPRFPIVFDAEGKLAQKYKITSMPYSLLIDRDGKTRYVHTGFGTDNRAVLEDELRQVLN